MLFRGNWRPDLEVSQASPGDFLLSQALCYYSSGLFSWSSDGSGGFLWVQVTQEWKKGENRHTGWAGEGESWPSRECVRRQCTVLGTLSLRWVPGHSTVHLPSPPPWQNDRSALSADSFIIHSWTWGDGQRDRQGHAGGWGGNKGSKGVGYGTRGFALLDKFGTPAVLHRYWNSGGQVNTYLFNAVVFLS